MGEKGEIFKRMYCFLKDLISAKSCLWNISQYCLKGYLNNYEVNYEICIHLDFIET